MTLNHILMSWLRSTVLPSGCVQWGVKCLELDWLTWNQQNTTLTITKKRIKSFHKWKENDLTLVSTSLVCVSCASRVWWSDSVSFFFFFFFSFFPQRKQHLWAAVCLFWGRCGRHHSDGNLNSSFPPVISLPASFPRSPTEIANTNTTHCYGYRCLISPLVAMMWCLEVI